jgi:hypothetical protein
VGFFPTSEKGSMKLQSNNHQERRSQGEKCIMEEKKELNLATKMRIKEELEMENPMKNQSESEEKLLCPKAGTATSSPNESNTAPD